MSHTSCPPRPRAHHAVTENVLLGEKNKIVGLKAMLERQDGNANRRLVELARIGPILDGANGRKAMIREDAAQPIGRTFTEAGHKDALSCLLQ